MYKNNGNTKLIVVVAVLIIIALSWLTFSKPKTTEEQLLQFADSQMSEIEKDVVKTLTAVGKIELKIDVFKNPAFSQLIDISRQITQEPIGRANPFAPIDAEAVFDSFQDEDGQGANSNNTDSNQDNTARRLTPREY